MAQAQLQQQADALAHAEIYKNMMSQNAVSQAPRPNSLSKSFSSSVQKPAEMPESLSPLSDEEMRAVQSAAGEFSPEKKSMLPRDLLIAKARAYREHHVTPQKDAEQLSMSLQDDNESGRRADEVKSPFSNDLDVPSFMRKPLNNDRQI